MSPDQAYAWLDSITGRGWKLELDRIEEALTLLGAPQDDWRAIHVAGTNGKGSTCAFIEGILLAAGVVCGRFTSPHVVRLEERVRVDGRDCTPEELAGLLTEVRDICEQGDLGITYFEAMTAVAFLSFSRAGVTVAAVEVGLGGRLDATRTCRSSVTVITSIGLDHTRLLGDTVEAIAGEKAGILRAGVPVVTATGDGALEVIERRAEEVGAGPVHVLGRDFDLASLPPDCRLPGEHQRANAACAIAACQLLDSDLGPPVFDRGLSAASIRGRLERVGRTEGAGQLWVDCAHNEDGARALAATIQEMGPERRVHLVFGCLQDKQAAGVLAILPADRLTVVTVDAGPRTRTAQELLPLALERQADARAVESPTEAVQAALAMAKPDEIVLIAGSVYLAGQVLGAADRGEFWPT